MTWQEALKIKQNWTAEQARNDLERLIITGERPADKVVGLACQALEKQIPKKPFPRDLFELGTATGHTCPTCGYDFPIGNYKPYKHCPECGQRIKRGDTE